MKWSEMSDKQKLETLRYRSEDGPFGFFYFALSVAVGFSFTAFAIYFPYLDKDVEFAQALVLELFKCSKIVVVGCIVFIIIQTVRNYISYRRHVKIMRLL